MARASFGGGVADFVISSTSEAGDALRFAAATLTMWSAETGGTQYTDLVRDGDPITTISVGTDGQIPTFQGPDEVLVMWASASGGPRVMIDAGGDIALRAGAAADRAEAAAAGVPATWQPLTVYTAGSIRVAPDGSTLSRLADGTSRASFDSTEKALWQSVLSKPGTIDRDTLFASTEATVNTLVPAASTTAAGKVELATSAETTTGTDAARAVTPAGVKAVIDLEVTRADGAYASILNILTGVAAIVSADGTAVAQKHNPIDATAAPRNIALPTATTNGTLLAVEKVDSTTNSVTITGNIRGTVTTRTLVGQYETLVLASKSDGSWWPIAGHKTKAWIDAEVAAAIAADPTVATAAATAVNTYVASLSLLKTTDPGAPRVITDHPSYFALWRTKLFRRDLFAVTADYLFHSPRGFDIGGVAQAKVIARGSSTYLRGTTMPGTGFARRLTEDALNLDGTKPQWILDRWAPRLNFLLGLLVGTSRVREITHPDYASSTTLPAGGAYHFRRAAEDLLNADGTTPQVVLDRWADRLGVTALKSLTLWGDSTGFGTISSGTGPYTYSTANPTWLARAASTAGATANNMSAGGLGPSEIATKQGGLHPAVTVSGNQIPASGAVTGTLDDTNGWVITGTAGAVVLDVTGTLAGVPGTFHHNNGDGSTITFTRTDAGAATSCPAGTPFYANQHNIRRKDNTLIMLGRNKMDVNAITPAVAAMVANISTKNRKYLIMGPLGSVAETNPSAGYTTLKLIHSTLAITYGARYYDLHEAFVAGQLAALTAAGITPTSPDTAATAADAIAPSMAPDGVHFTQVGYNLIGDLVAAKLQSLGWY